MRHGPAGPKSSGTVTGRSAPGGIGAERFSQGSQDGIEPLTAAYGKPGQLSGFPVGARSDEVRGSAAVRLPDRAGKPGRPAGPHAS
ncbi:hypothetical protein GCM10009610_31000 [Pseudonocardia xinjiangensis]